MRPRTGHWRGDAKIKNVFMQHIPEGATQRLLLEKGDIDIARELTPTDIEGIAGNADIKVQSDVGGQIYYLALNQKKAELANPKVQEAMRWAVDYAGHGRQHPEGPVGRAQAFLPQGFLGALDETPYSLDIEKAKALMAESGVTLPLEIEASPSATTRNGWTSRSRSRTPSRRPAIKLELDVGDGAQGAGDLPRPPA